jgi:hypothetical protein
MGSSRKMVSIHIDEIAVIMGFDSSYDSGFDKTLIAVGKTVDVGAFKKVSGYIRTLNTRQLKNIQERLKDAQTELEKAIDMAEELQVFDKLKG